MNDEYNHYSDLPKGIVNVVCFPRFIGAMTGVEHATQDVDGNVTVFYEGGTKESRHCPNINIVDDDISPTAIVSAVQSDRL